MKGTKHTVVGAVLVAAAVSATGTAALAADCTYVAPWGDDSKDGSSWENAMRSPELAVDRWVVEPGNMLSHQTLVISNGHYKLTKPITCENGTYFTITSYTGNPEDVILDGQGACGGIRVYEVAGAGDPGSWGGKISGLTVTNCVVTDVHGAGIYFRNSGGIVENCIIRDCHIGMSKATSIGRTGAGISASFGYVSGVDVAGCSITNFSGADGGAANGAGIYAYDTVVSNCNVRNCRIRMSGNNEYYVGAAGVHIDGSSEGTKVKQAVYDTVISACEIETEYQHASAGAGLNARCSIPTGPDGTEYRCTVSNCLIYACTNIYKGPVTVSGCNVIGVTVSNNVDNALFYGDNHGSGIWANERSDVRGCLITGNRGICGDDWHGGTPAVYAGPGSVVADCAIIGNSGPSRVGLFLSSDVLVSNCVFRGNFQTENHDTSKEIGCGLVYSKDLDDGTKAEIVDCVFVDNEFPNSRWGGWIWLNNSNHTSAYDVVIRNCLCVDNSFGKMGGAMVYSHGNAQSESSANLVFENCTIADNVLSGSYYSMIHGYDEGWVKGSDDKWIVGTPTHVSAQRIFVNGCIVVNNTGGNGDICRRAYYDSPNVNRSVFTGSYYGYHVESVGNRWYDASLPLFAGAGDYRLAAGSQAIDMVPPAPWMKRSMKDGSSDMGSGCEIVPDGGYGVSIRRINAARRLSGLLADAGCCEFLRPVGMAVTFR